MSNYKKNNFLPDENEEGNSLIKESSELEVQSLYQILIQNPYLVNAIDDKKETILSYSLKNNNIEIANLILTSPIIDLDYQDKEGNTYLHLAVNSQQEEIIKLLIEKGIFINKQNKNGNTALHLAYGINDNSIINLLIKKGIDKNILNKENKVAEEIKPKNKKMNTNINLKNENNKKLLNNNKYIIKNEYKTFIEKNKNINGARKKNISSVNNNRNNKNKKENNNQNENGNNTKSINSSESRIKMKVKSMQNQDIKNNNNGNNIIKGRKAFNDVINIEENYKNDNNDNFNENNKKFSEFEKTVKIDWDITKKHIIKNKENDEAKYLNYNYKEKKNNYGRDQDLCNFEDNNNYFNNQKNENMPKKNLDKIKVNKKLYNNINNKISPKQKKSEKLKNVKNITNKESNKNRNNNLGNSLGYNPCLSGEYTMRSEQKRTKNPSNSLFSSKMDISRSQNDQVNQYNKDESRLNTIQNNDNYKEINDIRNSNEKNNKNSFHGFSNSNKNQKNKKNDININKINNNPKRKTATTKAINRNFLISNKIENKEENNFNKISSNMESSLVTQSKLKSSHKKNNPLIEFLSQINLLKYLDNLDNNGFDDINLLIEEAKNGDIIKDQELKEAGVNIPGDRAKILIRIKEKANLFGFTIPKSVYYTLKNYDDLDNDEHIINLNDWLKNIKVDRYLMNFVNNGYHSIELLLMQMETENPLTTEILRDEIGIDKIGYRSRILNKLKEEGRSLNNKLKTSVLVVNNRGDNKNCECIIF